MCNLVGYAGNRPAAPILIEMLKRQEEFDGGMSTGIATIHEGKLYTAKVVGDIDTFLRETDAINLPGTIGIMHSRPGGNMVEHAHPFLTEKDKTAVILNGGLPADDRMALRNEWADKLVDLGFEFRSVFSAEKRNDPQLKDGRYVHDTEFVAHLIAYFRKFEGCDYPKALAEAVSTSYNDMVVMALSQNDPDHIYVNRLCRPMNIMLSGEESYLSTCEFGFPEIEGARRMSLPLLHTVSVGRGEFTVTKERAHGFEVAEMTPYTYHEGYNRICKFLQGKKDNPPYFDDLEFEITDYWKDLFPTKNKLGQYARLAYELLYQLDREGKLHYVSKVHENGRRIVHMYMD